MKIIISSILFLSIPASSLACAMPPREEVRLVAALEDIDALLGDEDGEQGTPTPQPEVAPEPVAEDPTEVAEAQPEPALELPVMPLDPGFAPQVIPEAQG